VVFHDLQPKPALAPASTSSLAIIYRVGRKVNVPDAGSKIVTPSLANPCALPNSNFSNLLIERVIKKLPARVCNIHLSLFLPWDHIPPKMFRRNASAVIAAFLRRNSSLISQCGIRQNRGNVSTSVSLGQIRTGISANVSRKMRMLAEYIAGRQSG